MNEHYVNGDNKQHNLEHYHSFIGPKISDRTERMRICQERCVSMLNVSWLHAAVGR